MWVISWAGWRRNAAGYWPGLSGRLSGLRAAAAAKHKTHSGQKSTVHPFYGNMEEIKPKYGEINGISILYYR